jgi:hypothetical protein
VQWCFGGEELLGAFGELGQKAHMCVSSVKSITAQPIAEDLGPGAADKAQAYSEQVLIITKVTDPLGQAQLL